MTSVRRGNRQAWVLVALTIAVLLTFVIAAATYSKQLSDTRAAADKRAAIAAEQQAALACVAKWVNTYTSRAQAVAEANSARVSALDELVRSLKTGSRAAFAKAYQQYLTASDRYQQQARVHPIPPEPRFLCGQARPAPGPVKHTASSVPAVTATRTVRVPQPRVTVFAPPHTVTVPGPTRVVTRTRMVTVAPGRRGHR